MVSSPVHTNPPLKGAAVETWMYEVSKRLIGFEPHIVSIGHPFYPAKEFRDGIFFHRIRFGRLYKRLFQKLTRLDPLPYPKRVFRIIEDIQPDVVHMHNSIKWFAPLIRLIDKTHPKTVLHMHNEKAVPSSVEVDAFVGCSNFIIDLYKNAPIKAGKRLRIYNGVDLERFKPHWKSPDLRADIRSRFGVKKEDFVALFVGRLSPEKGVEHFIKSASALKKNAAIKFFVIGEISRGRRDNDRVRYSDTVLKMASALTDKITFTDFFPPSKVHFAYLLGDALVLPSNFEDPFPIVPLEAMASGLPVITRRKGGLVEYITDGANGLFVSEEKTSEDIAARLDALISDNALRERLASGGRKTIEERFSWEAISAEVENLYSSLIE